RYMRYVRSDRRRLVVASAILSLLALGLLLAILLARQLLQPPSIVWATFVDPNGFYSVELPQTWRARHFEQGRVAEGIPPNSGGESVFFQDTDRNGMTIFLDVTASANPQERITSRCRIPPTAPPQTNAEVDGIPATYSPEAHDALGLYMFSTASADYQFDY